LFGTPEQRVFLARARAFVRFSATQRASLIGMQEWKARGPAAALAAGLGAPVLDPQALQVLTAEDALAALPDTTLTIPASINGDISIGLTFKSWVRIHDVGYQGVIAVMTDGMRRFGLPELRMGPASPELREELTTLLNGATFVWSDLIARTQDTPNAAGLLNLPGSNPGRTPDARSSATPGGNSHPECGPARWWRSRPGSSLTGASGWTAAASSKAPAPKAPATISRS
jgi:hypothetical protein